MIIKINNKIIHRLNQRNLNRFKQTINKIIKLRKLISKVIKKYFTHS